MIWLTLGQFVTNKAKIRTRNKNLHIGPQTVQKLPKTEWWPENSPKSIISHLKHVFVHVEALKEEVRWLYRQISINKEKRNSSFEGNFRSTHCYVIKLGYCNTKHVVIKKSYVIGGYFNPITYHMYEFRPQQRRQVQANEYFPNLSRTLNFDWSRFS